MGAVQSDEGPSKDPSKDPKTVVRAWKSEIRKSQRQLQRHIRDIETAQKKTKLEIQKAIKSGDRDSAKILAKEIVRSQKAADQIYTSSVHLSSIMSELDHQVALLRTTHAIQNATSILEHMNAAIKAPELAGVCLFYPFSSQAYYTTADSAKSLPRNDESLFFPINLDIQSHFFC